MKILIIDKLKGDVLMNTKSVHPVKCRKMAISPKTKLFNRVKGIIAVTGPDTFSTLRSNVAIANTLAFAWQIPVVGISRKEFKNRKELLKIGFKKLKKTKIGKFVMPVYDREPNIT